MFFSDWKRSSNSRNSQNAVALEEEEEEEEEEDACNDSSVALLPFDKGDDDEEEEEEEEDACNDRSVALLPFDDVLTAGNRLPLLRSLFFPALVGVTVLVIILDPPSQLWQ
jgi:hypothetical protein